MNMENREIRENSKVMAKVFQMLKFSRITSDQAGHYDVDGVSLTESRVVVASDANRGAALQVVRESGFATFGATGNIIIGLTGAGFGGMSLGIIGDQPYGFLDVFMRLGVGAFICVFCANIAHVVAGPKRY